MPMVKLDPSDARMPVLQWYPITRGQEGGGELLAAFELFLVSDLCQLTLLQKHCHTHTVHPHWPPKYTLVAVSFKTRRL